MGAKFLILQLGLIITFSFTESSEEPDLGLECINDYLTEMKCLLTLDQFETCSEYSLNASQTTIIGLKLFGCDFKQLPSSACECSLQVNAGFVLGEIYTVNVLRGNETLFTKSVSSTESSKPKQPVNVSVTETQTGNFLIVWDTLYKSEEVFDNYLIPEITYYVEGNDSGKHEILPMGQKEYEITGRNLESSSNYIVRVRVQFKLNSRFSDYSDSYRFTTSMSTRAKLKIIIPLICVIFIICIFIFSYFYKISIEWWNKIPTPNIATNFVKQVPNLLSFQNDLSPVHLDTSKLVHPGEKTWPASSLVDVRGENSLNSLGKGGNSVDVIYGQTGNGSLEENSAENNTHWELGRQSQSTNLGQIPASSKYYKNLKSDDCNTGIECTNSSGVSNKFYMLSLSEETDRKNENDGAFPLLTGNLDPVIPTDFEYGPCTGLSGSANTTQTQFTSSSNDIIVVPGYQSVNALVDCPSTDQAFISSQNDVNLIMEKLICNQNPQEPIFCESDTIPVENGYQDVQSLLQKAGKNLITEPELRYPIGSAFHTSPGIEIDCSYHRV